MPYGLVGRIEDEMTLPPGQRLVGGFPHFGGRVPPARAVPAAPVIEIGGAVMAGFVLPLTALATMPRREVTADFHCVAGWSATDLCWEGVAFETVYRTLIEPALPPGTAVSHVVFRGLDGWQSIVAIEDALADDVLIAEHLDGSPLDDRHGAPARLVSPQQYAFISTKHLCGIDVHTAEPRLARGAAMWLLSPHPRAGVWREERHRHLPAWLLRRAYLATIAPIKYLSSRGSRV